MTLQEMIESDKIILTPADVSDVLGADPQTIRNQASKDPAYLGFPVCRAGAYTKIPRVPFLRWLGVID